MNLNQGLRLELSQEEITKLKHSTEVLRSTLNLIAECGFSDDDDKVINLP
jgi:hypothetical protein